MSVNSNYVGRFAPSPSGPLHFGSLVCALASYLHAKQNNGRWLVRIEDIDTPRVDPLFTDVILNSLAAHQLNWDDTPVLQSNCISRYQHNLNVLSKHHRIYACECSRRQIRARGQIYDGLCRDRGLPFDKHALRFKLIEPNPSVHDLLWQQQDVEHPIYREDPVLKRADGIFAYHLAVVSDDIAQGVTHIVRGYDLFDTTPIHMSLYHALSANIPTYLHIPVVAQAPKQKLSKQHHSPNIDDTKALNNLKMALEYLGITSNTNLNMSDAKINAKLHAEMSKIDTISELLGWAIEYWQIKLLSKQYELPITVADDTYKIPLSQE